MEGKTFEVYVLTFLDISSSRQFHANSDKSNSDA